MQVIYIAPKNVKQTHSRSHCTSAKRITSILRHFAEAFLPARQGTILNSHRVIGIATNTSMVLNCALVTGCSLTSYPGPIVIQRWRHGFEGGGDKFFDPPPLIKVRGKKMK